MFLNAAKFSKNIKEIKENIKNVCFKKKKIFTTAMHTSNLYLLHNKVALWRNDRALDLWSWSRGREFDFRSVEGRYQDVSTWMGDCLDRETTKLYDQHQGQLSLPPLQGRLIRRGPACVAGIKARCVHLHWVAGDPIWQVTRWISHTELPNHKILKFGVRTLTHHHI